MRHTDIKAREHISCLKIFKWILISSALLLAGWFFGFWHFPAHDAEDVLRFAGLRTETVLQEGSEVYMDDHIKDNVSVDYIYDVEFAGPLPEKDVRLLDLNSCIPLSGWSRGEDVGCYRYSKRTVGGRSLDVDVRDGGCHILLSYRNFDSILMLSRWALAVVVWTVLMVVYEAVRCVRRREKGHAA